MSIRDLPVALYFCHICGRTVVWRESDARFGVPNTRCGPHIDESGQEFYVIMGRVWTKHPENEENVNKGMR